MARTRTFWIAALLVALIAVVGCGGATEAPAPTEVAVQPTATAAPTQAPSATPTEAPPTATPEPTAPPEPSATPTPEVADNSGCIACHTSQESLQAVAKVEPTAEPLSEGEG